MKEKFNSLISKSFDFIEPALTPMANILGHNKTHIKLDGSSFESRGLQSLMEKDHFRSSFVSAMAIIGFQVNQIGIGDVFSWQMLEYTSASIGLSGVCMGLLEAADRYNTVNDEDIAVDRTGNHNNKSELSNRAIEAFESIRNKGLKITSLMTGLGIYHSIYGAEPEVSFIKPEMTTIPFTIIMARGISQTYRYQMLINGHTSDTNGYVIADTPPENETHSKPSKYLQPAIAS